MMPTHLQGRHPVEVGLLASCAAAGLLRTIAAGRPSAVQQAMGTGWSAAWGALLLIGAVIALVGVFWRGGLEAALNLERAGLTAVTGALASAVAAILFRMPLASAVTGPIVAGIGGGLIVRIWHVTTVIRRADARAVAIGSVRDAGTVLGAVGGIDSGDERDVVVADPVADQPPEGADGSRGGVQSDR
jgi:hypothetical protein